MNRSDTYNLKELTIQKWELRNKSRCLYSNADHGKY